MTVRLLALALLLCACSQAREHTVIMRGMTFEPAELVVASGDRVRFVNEDIVAHTATAPGRFDSGALAPAAAWSVTVKKKGDVPYACTLHPMMKAKLIVR